jgi:hypothetical protein
MRDPKQPFPCDPELTHTIQQGASCSGTSCIEVPCTSARRVPAQVQRSFLSIPNPREYFAGKAAAIPGFTMLTVVIGFNPITNSRVERSPGNILRGAIQLLPGGSFITDALDSHGVVDRVSQWAATQFETLDEWVDVQGASRSCSCARRAHLYFWHDGMVYSVSSTLAR